MSTNKTIHSNLAFVFPGQGSQKVGMLADFGEAEVVKKTFAEASEVLGYDAWALAQEGPQDKLNMTETTQPMLLTSSVALWRLWSEKSSVSPGYMAGHSLGEWSALVCAGVVSFADAVRLVRSRGKHMQEAVPAGEGAMAAIIGLDDKVVEDTCASVANGEVVTPVNYNSPGQLVIAGAKAAIDRAIDACKEAGAKRALPLAVSAPFHTSMMKPAAEKLAAEIEATVFSAPIVPVVHNVTANTESDPEQIKKLIIEQVYSPVRWVECVQKLVNLGVDSALECGPGKVLSGLNKRIEKSLKTHVSENESSFGSSLEAFGESITE